MKSSNYFSLNWSNSLIIIIGFVFLSLSIYKAAHTAFTHDESFTYLSYVKKSVIGILTMEEPISANNHILNSIGMKVIDKLLAPTPFNLRLPNIFGHLLFIIFSALIINTYKNSYYKVIAFVLLNSNIYLIDFFSLARGYGLSLGFLMAHWYFLYKTASNIQNKNNFRLMLFALLLAMLSNFSVIYYTISLIVIYLIYEVKNYTSNKALFLSIIIRNMKFVLLLSSLTIVFLFGPLLKLLQFNQLYFGGTHNFFDDTIYSLVYYSTVSMGIVDFQIKAIFLIAVILMALIIAIQLIKLFKHKTTIESSFFIVSLVIIMLIQITFFYFFNTKYLIQRTALLLIPIFIFSLLGFVNDLGNIVIYFAAGFVSLFMFYLTLRFIPMDNSLNWQYDADNEKLLSELKTIYKKSDTQNKLSLGVDWIFQPSLNFYRATTDASSWLDTIVKEGYDYKKYEYYFVESASINKFVDTTQFRVLKTFPQSNNLLIKNLKFE
jgi:hypothetical protein